MTAVSICVANFKGGVGKSTSAVNISVCLARQGYRTLLVDLDPQANSSEMFIPEENIQLDMRSIIADRVPVEQVIQSTRISGLSVLPASFDLAYLDKELVVSPAGVQRIDRALRGPRGTHDYVVLDTGPNLSHLTLGALVAADHIIIPVSATVWSPKGMIKFVRWIDAHRDDEVLSAELLGVFATMLMPRTRVGRGLLADLAASPFPQFESWIPRRIGAEDAAMDLAVVGDPGMDISLTTAYRDLTAEIIKRVEQANGRHRAR